MKVVELYGRVRYAIQIEGLSRQEAARQFGIHPRTVAKMPGKRVTDAGARTEGRGQPSNIRGGSRMQESCPYGSVRGAPSNGRPYRNRERGDRFELLMRPRYATNSREVGHCW
jgi:hypothetical protein